MSELSHPPISMAHDSLPTEPVPNVAAPAVLEHTHAAWLARQAVGALLDEVRLTPKPALVDGRGSGAHHDVSLAIFERSAQTLRPFFEAMALATGARGYGLRLREELARIGRRAEQRMLEVTGGINTHRGAIWSIGLLLAASMFPSSEAPETLCKNAGLLACLPDRYSPAQATHGLRALAAYGATGARGEAMAGFRHVRAVGLPMLRAQRRAGVAEPLARIDALLNIMSSLEDTCLLHRGGRAALAAAQNGAAACLAAGGCSSPEGWRALLALDCKLVSLWASPGGSADLLAATLFVDRVLPEGGAPRRGEILDAVEAEAPHA